MHLPDGFLNTEVALACAVPAVAAVAVGLRRAEAGLDERRVPLLGVTAAFVFAGLRKMPFDIKRRRSVMRSRFRRLRS